MKTFCIYHKADFDGIFCREIAKNRLPSGTEFIGWDYGDPEPVVPDDAQLYILDLSVPGLMAHPNLIWIDHHKSAIDKYPSTIKGVRIDSVAACRLTWQWFVTEYQYAGYPTKEQFVDRQITEPRAVRLAGEYDVWDKRDPDAELLQHGLRGVEPDWFKLTVIAPPYDEYLQFVIEVGRVIHRATQQQNREIIERNGFDLHFEGINFLACNSARYNSHLFAAGVKPLHDALLGFNWDGAKWRVSLYGAPGKPEFDLSKIAVKYGGGGHKQACGFTAKELPFRLEGK